MGEEELLRARAVGRRPRRGPRATTRMPRCTSCAAAGLPVGQLADVLAPSLFGGHRLVVVTGVHEAAGALADVADQLRQGSRPRADAGGRPLRRQAQRGAGQGVHGGRRRARRVPQAQLGRRPGRLRPQRGPLGRRAGSPPTPSPRCVDAIGNDLRAAVGGGQPAGLRLRRHHRRRRGRPLPPRAGRGHRLHRRRAGAGRRPRRARSRCCAGRCERGVRARADRRRHRRRRPHRRPRRLAEHDQPRRAGPDR